jgi:hypothetical protein
VEKLVCDPSTAAFGGRASTLAGLHLHFFVRTLQLARSGDFGAFITSAEWLDVNYGDALRRLLADRLGGVALHVRIRAMVDAETGDSSGRQNVRKGHCGGFDVLRHSGVKIEAYSVSQAWGKSTSLEICGCGTI